MSHLEKKHSLCCTHIMRSVAPKFHHNGNWAKKRKIWLTHNTCFDFFLLVNSCVTLKSTIQWLNSACLSTCCNTPKFFSSEVSVCIISFCISIEITYTLQALQTFHPFALNVHQFFGAITHPLCTCTEKFGTKADLCWTWWMCIIFTVGSDVIWSMSWKSVIIFYVIKINIKGHLI